MKKGNHFIKNILTFGYYNDEKKIFVSINDATKYTSFDEAKQVIDIELKDIYGDTHIVDIVKVYND